MGFTGPYRGTSTLPLLDFYLLLGVLGFLNNAYGLPD